MHFLARQRVLVKWGADVSYAARVIAVRDELGRHGVIEQTSCRVEYEVDGQRLWHDPLELSPLEEDSIVAVPVGEDDPECVEVCGHELSWQLLPLRCCYSLEPLDDPARCSHCLHPSRCNYSSLLSCLNATRACPVSGCSVGEASILRSRDIIRDDALREALAALPPSAESCWVRGRAEVRLEAPTATAAASDSAASLALDSHKRGRTRSGAVPFPTGRPKKIASKKQCPECAVMAFNAARICGECGHSFSTGAAAAGGGGGTDGQGQSDADGLLPLLVPAGSQCERNPNCVRGHRHLSAETAGQVDDDDKDDDADGEWESLNDMVNTLIPKTPAKLAKETDELQENDPRGQAAAVRAPNTAPVTAQALTSQAFMDKFGGAAKSPTMSSDK